MTCEHEDFAVFCDVGRIAASDDDPTIIGYTLDVRGECTECAEQLIFHGEGLPSGLLPDRPCLSFDGKELRIPARMESDPPDFGLNLGGFTVRYQPPDRRDN